MSIIVKVGELLNVYLTKNHNKALNHVKSRRECLSTYKFYRENPHLIKASENPKISRKNKKIMVYGSLL